MSIAAMDYVRRLKLDIPARKLILTYMADRADEQFSCYPSISVIAAESEVQPRQVQKHLTWFREHGYLSDRVRYRANGSYSSNRYFLHGPWDNYGDTGEPFPEITYPHEESQARFLTITEGSFRRGTRAVVVSSRTGGVVSSRTGGGVSSRTGGTVSSRTRGVVSSTTQGVVSSGTGEPLSSEPPGEMSSGTGEGASWGTPPEPSVETSSTNPQVEPAPPARSAADGRRPGTGSGAAEARGASGASAKSKPAKKRPNERDRRIRRQAVDLVEKLPADLLGTIDDRRPVIAAAVKALADRTPEQVAARAMRRWDHHGHAMRWYTGEVHSPTGVAIALVEPSKCPDPRCDDGTNVDTGAECARCTDRQEDFRRERRQASGDVRPSVPAARAGDVDGAPTSRRTRISDWPECLDCKDPVPPDAPEQRCRPCRDEQAKAAAALHSALDVEPIPPEVLAEMRDLVASDQAPDDEEAR